MSVTKAFIVASALAGLLNAVPNQAIAQATDAQVARDLQELKDYRLSKPVIDRVFKAVKAAAATMAKDPKRQKLAKQKAELATLEAKEEPTEADQERMTVLEDEIDRFDDGDDHGDAASITEYARHVDAIPALATAVRSVGLTSREYSTAMLALWQAYLTYGLLKEKELKQAPPEVSKQNLDFVRLHEKEIAALVVEIAALGTWVYGED